MDGTYKYKIQRHNDIMDILGTHLNLRLLEKNKYYFGGGTLCSMKYGEYRESVDIDFLSSDRSGTAELKMQSDKITDLPLWPGRDPKIDKDGIRLWCQYKGACFKLEFIFESRIQINLPERFNGVLSLNPVTLMACKLLANSDRSYNDLAARKDIVDILTIYKNEPTALRKAWSKAHEAYGSWLTRCTKISLSEDKFDETVDAVGIEKSKQKDYHILLQNFTKEIAPLLKERGNELEL